MTAPRGATARAPLGSALRVALATLGGWVIAVSAVLALGFLQSGAAPSAEDLEGFFAASFIGLLLLAPLVWLPGLLWLRRTRGHVDAPRFALLAATLLNLPLFVLLALGAARGAFVPGEATMFGAIFVAVGAIFGRSLARAVR